MTQSDSSNYTLQAKSDKFHWEGTGQLSIKTFMNGRAFYKTSRGYFSVEEGRYLLVNDGPYTITIEENQPVESFCVFFKQGLAADVHRTLTDSTDNLVSDPYKQNGAVEFFERTYVTTPTLSKLLQKTKALHSHLDCTSNEEQYHFLMENLLISHFHHLEETESILAVKRSTREEIYRRICIAHEYIRAYFHQSLTIEDLAKMACLSPNHLIRTYSQLYGKTPHRHISEFRIEKAKTLLKNPELSMTDIAFELGFQNPASFTRMFTQFVGIPPTHFRKKSDFGKE
ncbi:helix-turn-helix domain-containing protein [Rossellomorea vietnamensis]|uniref:helix-turn-helix domain-containing protein n=1 Tax=Rossellomorea vietnamensis TaxID=218284 RepID=UPI001E4AE3A7|nr:AraC family transcriptional regulator [Rossellomorea vietnamensis]MCC5803439.1 helix-turn-helix transcriptional regulator [Rossellomorea vietnamensis]